MGQANNRGTYATRKAEAEIKAAQAEAERQEQFRAEQARQQSIQRTSTPVRDENGRILSPIGYRRERISHATLMVAALMAGGIRR